MPDRQPGAVRVRPWIRRTARVLLPILLLIAAWQIWDNVEAQEIEPLLGRLEAARHKPADPIGRNLQLQPWSQPNDAARYYSAAAAIAQHDYLRAGARDNLSARRAALANQVPRSAEVDAAAAETVAANEWALRLLDHAATLPMRFTTRSSDSNRASGLAAIGRAASHRALDRAELGDAAGAINSLVAKARLQRAFGPDQWGSGLAFGGQEIRGLAADIGIVLSATTPTPAEFERLDAALAEVVHPDTVSQTIAEMGLFRYDFVRSTYRGAFPVVRPIATHGLRASMATIVRALDASRLPWPDRVRAIAEVTDEKPLLRVGPSGLWLFAEFVQNLALSAAEAEAAVRAARAALVIEQRRKGGGPPDTLDGLALPTALADPFTGQTLKYATSDAGYVIYSVGRDGRDDGGALEPQPVRGVPIARAHPKDVGVRVVYRRAAASISPSNSGRNSPVR